MALKLPAPEAAKIAIQSIGCGYDISLDLRLKYCKWDSTNPHLIEIHEDQGKEIVLRGGILIPNVSKAIKCDKGERTRFRSDVLSFQQEEISSPLSGQILEFYESELFPETLQNSEVASSSNCYYEEHSSYANNLPFNAQEISNISNNGTTKTATNTPPMTTNNLSIIFVSSEDTDNDISTSIEFSPSPPFSVPRFLNGQQEQFDLSLQQNQMGMTDSATVEAAVSQYAADPIGPILGPPLPALHEEDCLSTMRYVKMNPSSPNCSFLDPEINSYLPNNLNAALSNEILGFLMGICFGELICSLKNWIIREIWWNLL